MAFFRPSDTFVISTPCFLGSKFEYSLTNYRLAKFAIRVYQARTFAMPNGNNHPRVCVPEVALSRPFAMPISNNRSDESAPERGNKPPAQGNTLGNKGNITEGVQTGQKRYHWEKNAFAPPVRNHHTAYNTQGGALGYMIVGLSGRRNTDML